MFPSFETHHIYISSEDMLAKITDYNKTIIERKLTWEIARLGKINCEKCNKTQTEEKECKKHEEDLKNIKNIQNIDTENIAEIKEILKKVEELSESECCGENLRSVLNQTCENCGETLSIRDVETCVFGNDVVALFPSIQAEKTGEIIRDKVEKTEVDFEGFNDKIGYIFASTGIKRGI